MKVTKWSLPKQILLALILGIIVGFGCYSAGLQGFTASYLKPLGTIFVNLLKFLVVPVVLLSMIEGIVSMGDMRKVGKVGGKTVLYFLCTTAIACIIGLGVGVVSKQLCYGAVVIPVAFLVAAVILHAPAEAVVLVVILTILMFIAHGGPCIRAMRGREPKTRIFS